MMRFVMFWQIWSWWLQLGAIYSSAETQNSWWNKGVCYCSLLIFFAHIFILVLAPLVWCADVFCYLMGSHVSLQSKLIGQHKISFKTHNFCCSGFLLFYIGSEKNCQLEWEWLWFRQLPLVLALTFAWMDDRYGTLFLSHISEDINNSPNFSGGLDWIINVGMSYGFLVACLDFINES